MHLRLQVDPCNLHDTVLHINVFSTVTELGLLARIWAPVVVRIDVVGPAAKCKVRIRVVSSFRNQMASFPTCVRAIYSVSQVESIIVACSFKDQLIAPEPRLKI